MILLIVMLGLNILVRAHPCTVERYYELFRSLKKFVDAKINYLFEIPRCKSLRT